MAVFDLSSPELWTKISELLDEDAEHVCVMPMTTIIKPVRATTVIQTDAGVTAAGAACPPGSVDVSATTISLDPRGPAPESATPREREASLDPPARSESIAPARRDSSVITYGARLRVRSRHAAEAILGVQGHVACVEGTLYDVAAGSGGDEGDARASTWTLISSVGAEGPVRVGDIVHVRSELGEGSYLDICGRAECAASTLFNVSTHLQRDRAGSGTGAWKIVSATKAAEGTELRAGDELMLRNQYGTGSYLDVCRERDDAGELYNVVTDAGPGRDDANTATWSFELL